jgi:hypothetical protein
MTAYHNPILELPRDECLLQVVVAWSAEFDRPSSQIECHGQLSWSLRPSGYEQVRVSGAIVAPPATEDHGDISDLPQLGPLGKRPEDPATGTGDKQRHADLG